MPGNKQRLTRIFRAVGKKKVAPRSWRSSDVAEPTTVTEKAIAALVGQLCESEIALARQGKEPPTAAEAALQARTLKFGPIDSAVTAEQAATRAAKFGAIVEPVPTVDEAAAKRRAAKFGEIVDAAKTVPVVVAAVPNDVAAARAAKFGLA